MDLLQQLQNAGREFAELRKLMKHAESLELEPHERELLTALGTALDGAHADMQKHGPAAIAEVAQKKKELIARVKETQEGLTQAEQELKALLAEPPAAAPLPSPPEAPPLDPQHGSRLARELLEEFADQKPAAVPVESRSVAEMHATEFSDSETHASSNSTEQRAPAKHAEPDEWHFGME